MSLNDERPPADALKFTLNRLRQNEPLDVIAMPPYDRIVPETLRVLFPKAEIRVTTWPVQGQSLAAIETWSKTIRKQRPHLVVVAIPGDAKAEDEETYIRLYNWVLNWSVDFGQAHWDLMPVLPSVTGALTSEQSQQEDLARRMIMGIDSRWVERQDGDMRPADRIVSDWVDGAAKR